MLGMFDTFSGIGGMSLAAHATKGIETLGFCEIDPFCQSVLRQHWQGTPIFGDIHDVSSKSLADAGIRDIDIICGGFPCQPVSYAGKRQGDQDARWLWPQLARLIHEIGPTWAVLENVPGLISKGLDAVLSDLDDLGYAWWTAVYPASAVGASHRRERVFIVAHSEGKRRQPHTRTIHSGNGSTSGMASWASNTLITGANTGIESGYVADPQSDGRGSRGTEPTGFSGQSGTQQHGVMADTGYNQCIRGSQSAQGRDAIRHAIPIRDEPSGCGDNIMAHASSTGLERWQGIPGDARPERTPIERGSGGTIATRETESRLGIAGDGVSGWMARRCPAGPGQAQHEWEAPRTVTGKTAQRAAKLKALGNAVYPTQVYPIFAAIMATENSTSDAA